MKKFFRFIFSLFIILILLCAGGIYGFKKIRIDYNGRYATERVLYSDEYEIYKLISYYPKHRLDDVNGFAIINIPVESIIEEGLSDSSRISDKEELLNLYKVLVTLFDDEDVSTISQLLNGYSTKSVYIQNKGYYFVFNAKDLGY